MVGLTSFKRLNFLLLIIILISFGSYNVILSTSLDFQWNIEEVGIPQAWQYTNGSSDVIVAVIDSGIDFSHPDLVNTSWINTGEIPNNGWDDDGNKYIDDYKGWDFQDNDNNPAPPHPPALGSKHGTFIAGLIAADNDNDIFTGIAPNIKIMSLRFLRDNLRFYASDWSKLVSAIDYAIENGADIINLSLQADGIPPIGIHEAIQRAYNAGILIVGVTGNYEDHVTFPGNYSEVIAVSATTNSREIADFSAYGSQTELCAPGADVYSISGYDSSIVTGSGTSFAAPLVTGAIALILSLNQSLTNSEIRDILSKTCLDLGEEGRDSLFGYGLLNVTAALSQVKNINTSSGTTPTTSEPPQPRKSYDLELLIISLYLLVGVMIIMIFKRANKGS
jgi:subtilisin family serine protease